MHTANFEGKKKEHKEERAEVCGLRWEARKSQETSSLELRKENSPADALILVQPDPFQTSDDHKKIYQATLVLYICGNVLVSRSVT